ncbi:hypothetical protein CIB84_002009 [Bambusicola thoracicus]|uniref:Immunoglobulin V-set domain-containing protein n=1 Tax=Bambusicola thoracicus TaxID=9083 RepID=A0A2P4TD01_BAMTH|nr:hypothetical protein CIB84_002009 [Bambusicola thoracicus]
MFLLFLRFSLGVEIPERKLAAEGSSVMMHAPAISNVNITEWEYIEGSTPKFILQYYSKAQVPIVYDAYQGRVVFYQNNGSLLLQQLREADSGIYKATVDLMQDRTRTTILEVIRKEAQTWLTPPMIGLLGISCLLLFVTSVIWMQEEGPSAAFILHGLYFLAAVIAMGLIIMISWCRPEALSQSPTYHSVVLCSTAMTLAVNLSFSFLLLHNFHQDHERGCSEPVDVITSCVLTVLAALLLLLLFALWYHKKTDARTQTRSTHGKEEDQEQNQDKESRLSLQHPRDDIVQEPS